jgi:enoyl-[acyl-carrier protein] reductase I
MASRTPDWRKKEGLAAGKGATVQEFVATVGDKRLEIDVAPWGEGHLKVNGREIAHVDDAKDRRQAFRKLAKTAERYLQGDGNRTRKQKAIDHDSYRES